MSPAEAAEREAARTAELEQLHATLTEQVCAIRNGEDWQRWLAVASRFLSYSLNNVLLIAAQRPDATAVAGFGAWKALGRQVDKGSKGIAILAPMLRGPTAGAEPGAEVGASEVGAEFAAGGGEAAAANRRQPDADRTGRPDESRRGIAGFKVVHVFDVSQTSGQPLPERPRPTLLAGQAPEGLWDALAAQLQARGFALRRGDCAGGANGLTHYLDRIVTVRADVDDAQAVKTLTHELGHVMLHDPTGRATVTPPGTALAASDPSLTPEPVDTSAGQCRGRLEVEAESVAYLATSAHGLDTGAYTFPYVAGWACEVTGVDVDQVVRGTATRVLAAAKVVLAGTEHLLEHADLGRTLEPNLTLTTDAARGAERTSALPTGAVATEDVTRRLADTGPAAVTPPPSAGAAVLEAAVAGRPSTAQADLTPQRLIEVHALTVDFYAQRLHVGGPDARRAVALLTERGVDRDSALTARLGYAPRAWTALVDHLRTAGVDDAELRASGLVLVTSHGTLVDRFRDRIIFPVETLAGQTVALLGRAVDHSATDRTGHPIPKYLNSPGTVIYSKSELLYGLGEQAVKAIAGGATPVLVEGPMDVLAVNRAAATAAGGAPAHVAVAPCGTALTTQQVRLLDTVVGGLAARGVVTAFDADGPGRQASLRAYDLLREVRAWPTALELPSGQDPASLAVEHGAAGLHAALLAAADKSLADLVVDDRIARHQLRWPEGQVAAGRDASAVVAAMPPEQVSRQIVRVSARTGLDVQTVSDLVVDAVSSPSRNHSTREAAHTGLSLAGPHGAATVTPGPVAGPGRAAPARAVATTNRSAAQRARAGFPVALKASLQPPAPAGLEASPPPSPSPDQQHRSRTA